MTEESETSYEESSPFREEFTEKGIDNGGVRWEVSEPKTEAVRPQEEGQKRPVPVFLFLGAVLLLVIGLIVRGRMKG